MMRVSCLGNHPLPRFSATPHLGAIAKPATFEVCLVGRWATPRMWPLIEVCNKKHRCYGMRVELCDAVLAGGPQEECDVEQHSARVRQLLWIRAGRSLL